MGGPIRRIRVGTCDIGSATKIGAQKHGISPKSQLGHPFLAVVRTSGRPWAVPVIDVQKRELPTQSLPLDVRLVTSPLRHVLRAGLLI